MPINPVRLGDRLEPVAELRDRLGPAEEQDAAVAQREIEQSQDLLLRLRLQIDQQIAAGHQVEARKRRIGQHILRRKYHQRAQLRCDPVALFLLLEETGEPRRRHVGLDRFRIEPLPGESHRVAIGIGRKHLQRAGALCRRQFLQKQHGDGIGLLACAAAGHPDPQRLVRRLPAHQIGNNFLRQQLEGFRVAKEPGDVDQQILGEEIDLTRILTENFEIPVAIGNASHRHAALDPTLQRPRLVESKVVRRPNAQQVDDRG